MKPSEKQFLDKRAIATRDKLYSFMAYIQANPEQRFWQALRNWAGVPYVLTAQELENWKDYHDTFYDE